MSEKLVILKKPAAMVNKERKRKTLDKLWPQIVTHVSANPQLTDDDLFNMYAASCNETDKVRFIRRCKVRGLKELRVSLREVRNRNTSIEVTKKQVVSIDERRKKGGIRFITKMDRLVRSAVDSLDTESQAVKVGDANLGEHISNMKNLVKVGKDVYNIDADNGQNTAKLNVAVLMNFDPSQNMSGEVTDI